jgi:serine/threonine-protein kinase HipA
VAALIAGIRSWRGLATTSGSPHARPKVRVNVDRIANVTSTSENAPPPWLVKFSGQGEQAEACSIEFFYADMARLADIQLPETQLFTLADDLAAFGIERFDRTNGKRFPIHTVAGLTHADFRHPALDYLSVLRLTRFLTADEREVLEMYHRRVINVVFHNHDDHSINLPFLLPEDGQWGVAPGYDQTFCFLRES